MARPSGRAIFFEMRIVSNFARVVLASALSILAGCNRHPAPRPDHPRLTPNVTIEDVTFRSASLEREISYRVILPKIVPALGRLPVVYLLHGGGGDFREWSNDSDVAGFAEKGLILVMPEGESSYYTNAVDRPHDRFEDFIVKDLIADIESRFPVDAQYRAIVGNSMGGFGAIKLALKYPEVYQFVGALSPAIDVPIRPFSIKRIGQYRSHASIFGAWGSSTRHDNDPFFLARKADPNKVPFMFVTCGEQEGLLPSNRQFAKLLSQRNFRFEFHVGPGGHNWNQWNSRLPDVFASLVAHIGANSDKK
jgi:S-formylglutathione hydrolase FrmB